MATSLARPHLTVRIDIKSTQFVLMYELHNSLSERIYVFDRPFSKRDDVNLCLGADDLVLLLHGISPRPPSPPYPPYETVMAHPSATRLEPGAELTHRIVSAVPLEERTAYMTAQPDQPATQTYIMRARLIVEYVRNRNVTHLKAHADGLFYVTGDVESVVVDVPLQQPVLLNARLDPRVRVG